MAKSVDKKFKSKILDGIDFSTLKPKQLRFLEAYVKGGLHITNACKAVGISHMTFYVWKKDSPPFMKVIEDMQTLRIDRIEDAFKELVDEKNPQAVMFGLKTIGRNRGYVERQEVTHFGMSAIKVIHEEPTVEKIVKDAGKELVE